MELDHMKFITLMKITLVILMMWIQLEQMDEIWPYG
jgi:hypothetical protein